MSSFLDLEGLKIRYFSSPGDRKLGDGKPSVVLFHGNAFSLDDWISNGTIKLLEQAGYPVLAIDLPSGKGSKSTKVEKKRVEDYVPILEEVFKKLEIGTRSSQVVIVGPSMGGSFALAYALAHQDVVSGLVLIAPSLRSLDESQLSQIETPVLLVWGEKDRVFPLDEYGRNLKNMLPRSRLLILKGAGHPAYLDKPEEFHELLIDFLNDIS